MSHGSADGERPFREWNVRLLAEIEHRPGLDKVLSRRQTSIPFVKHFPFFTATPGYCPLFFRLG
jgi:hypothetical protein